MLFRSVEDGEDEAAKTIDAAGLDEEAGEHGGDRRGGRGVRVGEPGVERNQGGLKGEAHEEKGGGQVDRNRQASTGAKGLGDLGEVEVAGGHPGRGLW